MILNLFLYLFVVGILPALIWLLFWLREDNKTNPEPKWLIFKVFILTAFGAFLVFLIQSSITRIFQEKELISFLFVLSEEVVKFLIVYFVALKTRFNDENLDPLLYMVIGAVGFSMMENIFYLFKNFQNLNDQSIISVLYRYIGATIIHISASASFGIALALTYYKKKSIRILFLHISLIFALLVHLLFNKLVDSNNPDLINTAFYSSWVFIIILLIIFEYFRKITKNRRLKK